MAPKKQPNPLKEERQRLFTAIGRSITRWAGVEDALANLFAYFVTGKEHETDGAKAAFHATINFNAKLAMTDAAAPWRISGKQLEKWGTLFNRLRRKVKKRNDLAHFGLVITLAIPSGEREIFLTPSLQNVNLHMGTPEGAPKLRVQDVVQRGESFKQIAKDLSDFAIEIGAVKAGPLPEPLAQLLEIDADSSDSA